MQKHSRGTGNRYANDGGGNHIQREIDKEKKPDYGRFNMPTTRLCCNCHLRKPMKGGSTKFGASKWICAECNVIK